MTAYIIRRLLYGIIVLLVITIFIFLAMRLLPGDPILICVVQQDVEFVTPEILDQFRAEYGLDRPLLVQYFDWLFSMLHGDLGKSIHYQEPGGKMIV
jgi:peptide/nickel transport system permease protein